MPDPSVVVWDDWVLLGVQVATLIFLAIYVVKTWQMASATKDAAEASARTARQSYEARMQALAPRVLVYFNPDEIHIAELVVENRGAGTAEDVRFEFEPELQNTRDDDPQRFFDEPTSIVPPGFKARHTLDTWPALLNSDLPNSYTVTIRYRGLENEKEYSRTQTLDPSAFEHRREITRKSMHDLVEAVEDIGKDLPKELERFRRLANKSWSTQIYSGLPPDDLEDAIRSFAVQWKLFRDQWHDGMSEIWLDPALDSLRTRAFGLAGASGRKAVDEELGGKLMALATKIFQRHRADYDAWSDEVDAAVQDVIQTIEDGKTGD